MELQEAAEEAAGHAPRARRRSPVPRASDRVLAGAVAAVPVVAVVLFGAVEPGYALAVEAAALALGAWAVVTRARRGDRPLPYAAVTLPLLLLAAIPALQLAPLPAGLPALIAPGARRFLPGSWRTISVAPETTLLALVRWLAYAAYLIAALEVLPRRGAVATALGVVAALGMVEAAYGILSLLGGDQHVLWFRRDIPSVDATGTLINRNHYAAVLDLCLPALLARGWLPTPSQRPDVSGRNALLLAGAAVMGIAVLLSHSRAGTACLGIGLALGATLASRASGNRHVGRMALAVALVALAYGAWVGLEPLTGRLAALPAEGTEVRGALWRDALDVARDFPVAGVGAGAFEPVFPAYRRRLTVQTGWAHAHQDTLELAIEGGLPAVVLAVLAGAAFVRGLRRRIRSGSPDARAATMILCGGIVAVLLHAQVDFPLHIPGVVLLLLLVAAAAMTVAGTAPVRAPQRLSSQRSSARRANRRPPWSR